VIRRGDIWWANVDRSRGDESRQPVLVVSSDAFNRSQISSVVAVTISSDLRLAAAPGNVELPSSESGLPASSVVNVAQLVTLGKTELDSWVATVSTGLLRRVEAGLRLVLQLGPPG
jgi:mRNA interferase MazF